MMKTHNMVNQSECGQSHGQKVSLLYLFQMLYAGGHVQGEAGCPEAMDHPEDHRNPENGR